MSAKATAKTVSLWVAIFLTFLVLSTVAGGRPWEYMKNHLWISRVLPLVLLFLILMARALFREYRGSSHRSS